MVDLATNGTTDGGSNCTTSAPCPSLIVKGRGIVYTFNDCNAIEADLYDYDTYDAGTQSGDWKGKQRMLHASASSSAWTSVIHVAWATWYYDTVTVGTIVAETSARCPWQRPNGYHVHQDFMLPTQSAQNCVAGWNTPFIPDSPGTTADLQRQNPDHYVHYLRHAYGAACVVPGPDAANFLLGSGGALDDTGARTRSLAATGQPITSGTTCFTQSTWCGTMTVTPQVVVAAYRRYQGMRPIDYFNAQQTSLPAPGNSTPRYWYGPDSQGYFLRMWWFSNGYVFPPGGCAGPSWPGNPNAYFVQFYSSAAVTCNQQAAPAVDNPATWPWPPYGWTANYPEGLQRTWADFRGAGGVNPSLTPSQLQQEANTWVQTQIDGGHWVDVVKPNMVGAISSARNQKDMNTLGITANPGNSFDGMRWTFP